MDELRQEQEVILKDQDENTTDELYLVPIYFY